MPFANHFEVTKFELLDPRDVHRYWPNLDTMGKVVYRFKARWADSPDEFHQHLIGILFYTAKTPQMWGDDFYMMARQDIDSMLTRKIIEWEMEQSA